MSPVFTRDMVKQLAQVSDGVPGLWVFNGTAMGPVLVHHYAYFNPVVMVCAWCPDSQQKTKAAMDAGKLVSHTMCPSCAAKLV